MANISQNVNIEMLEKLPDGSYKKKHPETKASQVKLEDVAGNFVATEIEGAMNELFTNVSNGKQLVGGAITDVDDSIVIPADPTFQDLANAVGQISTGKKWASGTVSSVFESPLLKAEVTGLDFVPSVVLLERVVSETDYGGTVYNDYFNGLIYREYIYPAPNSTTPNINIRTTGEYGTYVANGGFKLTVKKSGLYQWVAYE